MEKTFNKENLIGLYFNSETCQIAYARQGFGLMEPEVGNDYEQ